MGLKRKITKEEYDALSKEIQKEYWKQGEDYVLDVESDDDDPGELRRAHAREKAEAKRLKKENDDLQKRLTALEEGEEGEGEEGDETPPRQRRRKVRDAATIDATWREKMENEKNAAKEKQDKLRAKIRDREINGAAAVMAAKISTMPTLLSEQLKKRMVVEFDDDDEPTLVILGKNGKPSDMSLEQLEREFVANKEYAAIIIGSKASGGGAPRNGSDQKPGGAVVSDGDKSPDLSKMTPKDLAAHLKAQKEANG